MKTLEVRLTALEKKNKVKKRGPSRTLTELYEHMEKRRAAGLTSLPIHENEDERLQSSAHEESQPRTITF